MLIDGVVADIWDAPLSHSKVRGGTKVRVDATRLAAIIKGSRADQAIVENVHAMPGNGVVSMFSFGRALGIAEGVISSFGIPITWVAPVVWKAALKVPADKNAARARASALLPRASHHWPLVKHDGRAEAALIALYGARAGRPVIEW